METEPIRLRGHHLRTITALGNLSWEKYVALMREYGYSTTDPTTRCYPEPNHSGHESDFASATY